MEQPRTPELDKLTATHVANLGIQEFLGWLAEHGYQVCRYEYNDGEHRREWQPWQRPALRWIEDFRGVDPDAAEAERLAILDAHRRLTARVDP